MVLIVFHFVHSLPDSPAEPDIEHDKKVTGEPKVIPHDEVSLTGVKLPYWEYATAQQNVHTAWKCGHYLLNNENENM